MHGYLLDTNIFIAAKDHYYPFDVVPKFWTCLKEHGGSRRVLSIDRVREELIGRREALEEWVINDCGDGFFLSTNDEDIATVFQSIMEWVNAEPQFFDYAKREFAGGADGWLIAAAKVGGRTVVTQEEYNPETKRTVPIPNVCRAFDVECCGTFDMLRQLGERWT